LLRDVFEVAGDRVEESMAAVSLRACAEEVTLVAAECGEDAVLVGAAETLWQRLLVDPASTLGTAS
jgi:hypothetical protein